MTFAAHKKYWEDRRKQLGDSSVGRKGEDHVQQGLRIAKHLKPHLEHEREIGRFPEHGLDFGCGYGRIVPYLAAHCGHLWAADIFDDWTLRAASGHVTVTPLTLDSLELPLEDGSMDLIADIMTTQGFSPADRNTIFDEFQRVSHQGTLVISLSNSEPDWPERMSWLNDPNVWNLRDVDKAGDRYCLTVGCLL